MKKIFLFSSLLCLMFVSCEDGGNKADDRKDEGPYKYRNDTDSTNAH